MSIININLMFFNMSVITIIIILYCTREYSLLCVCCFVEISTYKIIQEIKIVQHKIGNSK